MRRSPAEEGERWLEQAEADLHWAEHLRDHGAYHLACFLSQQVAEKALKGYLYAQGEETVPGRSVERLCARSSEYDETFAKERREWGVLDGYYLPTRYPNTLPESIPARVYSETAAREAVRLATEVVEFVRSCLS